MHSKIFLYKTCLPALICFYTHFTLLPFSRAETLDIISIFHVCMVWIEKSVTRVTDRHHEAFRVMPNSDPE